MNHFIRSQCADLEPARLSAFPVCQVGSGRMGALIIADLIGRRDKIWLAASLKPM